MVRVKKKYNKKLNVKIVEVFIDEFTKMASSTISQEKIEFKQIERVRFEDRIRLKINMIGFW